MSYYWTYFWAFPAKESVDATLAAFIETGADQAVTLQNEVCTRKVCTKQGDIRWLSGPSTARPGPPGAVACPPAPRRGAAASRVARALKISVDFSPVPKLGAQHKLGAQYKLGASRPPSDASLAKVWLDQFNAPIRARPSTLKTLQQCPSRKKVAFFSQK